MNLEAAQRSVYFVYDGECPLCEHAALAFRIKQDYGKLSLINARDDDGNEIVKKINAQGLDLDEGMVIYDEDQFYHGQSALKFMAKYSQPKGFINLSSKLFYWSETFAKITYPWLRGVRNYLVIRKEIPRIDNLNFQEQPIFKSVFGDDWHKLPKVMLKHYANRSYSLDSFTCEGELDVISSGPIKYLSFMLWRLGMIPPSNEKSVPVTVSFQSDENTKAFHFNRVFKFSNRKAHRFNSKMIHRKDNELIEVMKYRIGWRVRMSWHEDRVKLIHQGYALCVFGHFIPVPLSLVLGIGYGEEIAIDDDTFDMTANIRHPWWGKIYQYSGRFKMIEKNDNTLA